jgi:CubicO group peptidase (beta-lactamase class C family)
MLRSALWSFAAILVACAAGACGPARTERTTQATPADTAGTTRRLDGTRITTQAVDATVERLMQAGRVPGLALAIIDGGEIVHMKGYGYRDVKRREPMTEHTIMAGASFTKAAFAFAVMQLVDEGRLDLDRPVVELFDKPLIEDEGYRDLAGDPRFARVTPRMLLSHTAGFPNWRSLNDDGKLDIKAEPGTRYMYSGEGISLMQRVFREVNQKSTTEVMRERVFAPFGMTRTSMIWQPEYEAQTAVGYDADGKPLGHGHREHPDAAGSMDTTVRDWATFLCALLRSERLSPGARDEMLRPQIRIKSKSQFPTTSDSTTDENDGIRLSYGLGWGLFFTPHGKAYFKEGHDDGFQSYSITFEDPRTGIVIMTNSDNGESIFKPLLEELIGDTYTPWRWEGYVPYDQRGG